MRKIEKTYFFYFYIYKDDIKSQKLVILTTPKWAVVNFSDFDYTELTGVLSLHFYSYLVLLDQMRLARQITRYFIGKPVTQGQYVVSDTHCPALHDCEFEGGSKATSLKGTMSCRTQGDFRLFVHPPVGLRGLIRDLRGLY